MTRDTQAPGLPAPPARQSRGRGPALRAGPHPGRPRPRDRRAGAHRGHRRSGPSSASTTTGCSAAAARAGAPDLPDACAEPFIPCSGSRSWSCSAACPGAARQGSSRTAPCRTDGPTRELRRRGRAPGGNLFGLPAVDDRTSQGWPRELAEEGLAKTTAAYAPFRRHEPMRPCFHLDSGTSFEYIIHIIGLRKTVRRESTSCASSGPSSSSAPALCWAP